MLPGHLGCIAGSIRNKRGQHTCSLAVAYLQQAADTAVRR